MPLFGAIQVSKIIFERISFQPNEEHPNQDQDEVQNGMRSPVNMENVQNPGLGLPKIILVIPNHS